MLSAPKFPSSHELFNHLLAVISSDRFLQKQISLNEVPFFICPHDPQITVMINELRANLVTQLANQGITVLQIDLYSLAIEVLKGRGIWERVLEIEQDQAKDAFLELLQGVLDTETHLIPKIAQEMKGKEFDVLFLSGIGEVFPYIRSHNVLNNLQSTAKDKPTLLFFPGRYTYDLGAGASLDLFGQLQDDKYYRATNILEYGVRDL